MKSGHFSSKQPIGMFDTGVGGLTVMQQLLHVLPKEKVIYFGDTARVPYGGKSSETILRYSIENTTFLMKQSIKLLVIACNTVTAYALSKLQQLFPFPVIGVIEPGAERAVQVTKTGRIAVIATKATVQSGMYQKEILKRLPQAYVTAIPCPLFVPLVEEHFLSHEATRIIIKEYLQPLKRENIDTLVLGCTHYPLLRPLIQEVIGKEVTIVDSASTCAEAVSHYLKAHELDSPENIFPEHRYIVSDDPDKFRLLGKEFLGMPLSHVELHHEQ